MSDKIRNLIEAIAGDITVSNNGPSIASHCEPDRRLLALLLAYELGDEIANKVIGDENNA